MPGPGDSAKGLYRLAWPETVRQSLVRAGAQARQLGVFPEFLAAGKVMDARLRSDPLGLGEPLYTLRNAGLEVRLAALAPLSVRYAVDRARQIVYIVEFRLLAQES